MENENADLKAASNQESDPRLNNPVGTIEPEKLGAKKVKVLKAEIQTQYKKDKTTAVGDIVKLTCKHPDKDEPIVISKVRYEVVGKLKESGIWYNEDTNKEVQKGSALSILLAHYSCANVRALEALELDTVINEQGYLIIKAY